MPGVICKKLMKGIRIQPKKYDGWDDALPLGREPFEFLFSEVLSTLSPLYWFVDNESAFDYFEAEKEFGEECIEDLYVNNEFEEARTRGNTHIGVTLMRPAFLPKLANYIRTDHNGIIGIAGDETSVKQKVCAHIHYLWTELQNPNADADFIINNAVIYFSCNDGNWWDVYAQSDSILKTIRAQCENITGLLIENLDEKNLRTL